MSGETTKPASHKLFLSIVCLLAAAPVVKIGDVQLLELVLFSHLLWLSLTLVFQRFRAPLNTLWRSLGAAYAIFFFAASILALASLRFRFFPPLPSEPFLKQPLVLSLARLAELFLGAFYMLYIASILRSNAATRMFATRFYFWTGISTTIYAVLSIPLNLAAGLDLGVYYPNLRARGLFNEGGPYGLYLISVIVVGLLLYRVGGLTKFKGLVACLTLLPIFLLTQSKAAIGACLLLFLVNTFIAGTHRLKLAFVIVAVAFGTAINSFTTLGDSAVGYLNSYLLIQDVGPRIDESVYGGFGGRVAGAVLLPRMLMAHPITGIGLGNYPLLFNDPHYLQGLTPTNSWELPGMGLLEYVAELGLPLFLYLFVLLLIPAWMASRNKSLPIVMIFAGIQPLVHIFGTQLNFYYPWICSGLALSFLDYRINPVNNFHNNGIHVSRHIKNA